MSGLKKAQGGSMLSDDNIPGIQDSWYFRFHKRDPETGREVSRYESFRITLNWVRHMAASKKELHGHSAQGYRGRHRFMDTAQMYGNKAQVGESVAEFPEQNALSRQRSRLTSFRRKHLKEHGDQPQETAAADRGHSVRSLAEFPDVQAG
jgi:hypothetical protein